MKKEVKPKIKGKHCSICKEPYYNLGNNAQPINKGRCCDDCNGLVVTERIKLLVKNKKLWTKS